MRNMTAAVFLILLVLHANLASASRVVVGREASFVPPHIQHVGASLPHQNVQFMIALKHSNADKMERMLLEVSDPRSPSYGKYLTGAEIGRLFAPSHESTTAVLNWLNQHNIQNYQFTKHREFVKVSAPVSVAEEMLATKFHMFQDTKTGSLLHRIRGEISIPDSLQQHIAFVGGVSRFSKMTHKAHTTPFFNDEEPSTQTQPVGAATAPLLVGGYAGNAQLVLKIAPVCPNGSFSTSTTPCSEYGAAIYGFQVVLTPQNFRVMNLTLPLSSVTCSVPSSKTVCTAVLDLPANLNYIPIGISVATYFDANTASPSTSSATPAFMGGFTTIQSLAAQYKTNMMTGKNANNKQAVAEFSSQFYDPVDLNMFFDAAGLARSPVANVIGPNDPTNPGGEATLDIEYIMGVGIGVTTWFWSLPGQPDAEIEPFYDWIMQFANYTDDDIPKVHSISYGDVEKDWDGGEMDRINQEFQKAGLRGISLVFSSGDDGVGNAPARNDTSYCTPFTPSFPASSPYVTSVGATQQSTLYTQQCAMQGGGRAINARYSCDTVGEIVCSSDTGGVITTGGGFSNHFTMPAYQKTMVNNYITVSQTLGNLPPNTYYTSTGRAYPDISTNGHNYLVVLNRTTIPIHGTSASAPVFAGMVALLNDVRMTNNQPSLGFLNPWLYQLAADHPEAFNDIVMGHIKCAAAGGIVEAPNCCQYGFYATPGWDAATGIGSPRFDVILNLDKASYQVSGVPQSPIWITVGIAIACVVVMATVLGYVVFRMNRSASDRAPLVGNE